MSQFEDIHPDVAEAARKTLQAAATYGVGSPKHEEAKTTLAQVAHRVLAETNALREKYL